MEPSQPPQDSPPPRQGWPAPEPSNPMGAAPAAGPPAPGPYAAPGPYTVPGPYTAPGPYTPYGPGAALGPGPGPYGAPPTTNGLAIASLVSGIVCCVPPLGLVFGLIALPQIKKRNQTGKGLAISGIVLSSLSCLLMVVGLVTGGFGEAWKGFKEGMDEAASSKSPFSLRTGECFEVDGELESYTTDVGIVDCAKPHDGEVVGGFTITGFDTWPGDDRLDKLAEERCFEISSGYAMDGWAIPERVWDYFYIPSRQSWRAGDRAVTCTLAVDGGEPLKGSLRADATTLDPDQLYYLENLNPVEEAVFAEPDEDADADFAANKAWATRVHRAIVDASKGLKNHRWSGTAVRPVADLGKELDAAAKQWDELARSADADAYWESYDLAFEALPEDIGADVREALGLAGSTANSRSA
ncbi:DUF4190 domain-containing protein [Streptomyces sp. NPDC047971]|uniref:DUF4190 domain-containing protein n=1 Tax=Streptomyces sp. NPDC047971 TaxID=3154499 RepID=UPI00340B1D70